MEFINLFFNIFQNQDSLFRIMLVIIIALYGLFALILFIQIRNLNKIINQITFSPIFKALTAVHLFATLALFFIAVLSL